MHSEFGIYQIKHLASGKVYVGSAINIDHRFRTHILALQRGTHYNRKLQSSWNKYGEQGFHFEVLEFVFEKQILLDREQFWIDSLESVKRGFNIAPSAGNMLGFLHSEESKKKMSKAQTGKKRTVEACAKTSAGLKGISKSPEHIANAAAARAAVKKPFSDEHRAKLSAAHKDRKRAPLSDATKAKIAAAHLGKSKPKHTDKQRKARSEWQTGRRHTEDSIERMRIAQRLRFETCDGEAFAK